MALSERRIVSQVTVLPAQSSANVQWSNQILRDGQVISEQYERKAYTADMRSEFIAEVEVPRLDALLAHLGWPSS